VDQAGEAGVRAQLVEELSARGSSSVGLVGPASSPSGSVSLIVSLMRKREMRPVTG
jgi:hypothetical protein